jgi:hypothetical protein
MPRTIAISHRALIQRLDRALLKRKQRLIGPRGRAARGWFILDTITAKPVRMDIDLVTLARELNILCPWETFGGKEE